MFFFVLTLFATIILGQASIDNDPSQPQDSQLVIDIDNLLHSNSQVVGVLYDHENTEERGCIVYYTRGLTPDELGKLCDETDAIADKHKLPRIFFTLCGFN